MFVSLFLSKTAEAKNGRNALEYISNNIKNYFV